MCFNHAYQHVVSHTHQSHRTTIPSNQEHQPCGLTICANHDYQPGATNLLYQPWALIVHTEHDHWPCIPAMNNQSCIPNIDINHVHQAGVPNMCPLHRIQWLWYWRIESKTHGFKWDNSCSSAFSMGLAMSDKETVSYFITRYLWPINYSTSLKL